MTVGKVRRLYWGEGLSAREVGERLGKTVWQVIKFMKKHNIPRRRAEETQKIQFQKKPLSYKKKSKLSQLERRLYEVGLMLYWAEGAKADKRVVDFANSDWRMVLIFLRMLRDIYCVDEKKLRVLLYCYANQVPDELISYWSKLLKIPRNKFYKPYIRKDFRQDKTQKMPYGLVHIRYADVKLFSQIQHDIGIIASEFT
jgi:hypothetical protein